MGPSFWGPYGRVKRPTLIIQTAETLTVHEAESLDITPENTLAVRGRAGQQLWDSHTAAVTLSAIGRYRLQLSWPLSPLFLKNKKINFITSESYIKASTSDL